MAFRGIPTFEERYAEHIRPEALALVRREAPITLAEYEAGRWNSYEWHLILRRLDDDAFAVYADHNIKESRPAETRDGIFTTYTEALIGHVAPELLRRWKALRETRVRAISAIQCAVEGALKQYVTRDVGPMTFRLEPEDAFKRGVEHGYQNGAVEMRERAAMAAEEAEAEMRKAAPAIRAIPLTPDAASAGTEVKP